MRNIQKVKIGYKVVQYYSTSAAKEYIYIYINYDKYTKHAKNASFSILVALPQFQEMKLFLLFATSLLLGWLVFTSHRCRLHYF